MHIYYFDEHYRKWGAVTAVSCVHVSGHVFEW